MHEEFKYKLKAQIKISPNEKETNQLVSENLKDILNSYNLDAKDLADICNTSLSGVYKWLRGESAPKITIMDPLCQALNVPLNTFTHPHGVMKWITSHQIVNGHVNINDVEDKLIKDFRQLSPKKQNLIMELMNILSEDNPITH